ncbi:MAG: hypothetical protein HKN52_05730 [Eudoraea sp.]|nr:hypothetical protein [Eudoraea sp.]
MAKGSDNNKPITRRGILPILGSTLLLPFIGFNQSNSENEKTSEDEDTYETLLKPDGTTVKVKVSALKNSNVVKKNISNKAFLNWLDKKL